MANIKTFSSKSNAKRAAAKLGITDEQLVQVDGKWGFEVAAEESAQPAEPDQPVQFTESQWNDLADVQSKPRSAGSVFDLASRKPVVVEVVDAGDAGDDSLNLSDIPAPASSPFAGMAHALVTKPATQPNDHSTRENKRTCAVEKDRPEQNGIKRPSAGGLCRAVWDKCDEMREAKGGEIPTSKDVKAAAEVAGWNPNNALIEFYQWRKFNGITGRAKKAN